MDRYAAPQAGAFLALLAVMGASGCVSDPYYAYPAYLTDDAVIIERQLAERSLAGIRPAATPIHGSVAVDQPQRGVICRATGLCESKDLSSYELSVALEREAVRNRSMAEALIRSRAFDSVAITEDCDMGGHTVATDWTIRVLLKPEGKRVWLLYRNATGRMEMIQFDAAAAAAVRMASWVDGVVAMAARMAGEQTPVAAAAPATAGWGVKGCPGIRDVTNPWRAADVVNVAMAPQEWLRTEILNIHPHDAGEVHYMPWSGPAWTAIFAGDPGSQATFTIVSTRIFVDYVGLAVRAQYHYAYEGTLAWNGHSWPIRGEAISGLTEHGQSTEAVVLDTIRAGVADAARQVRTIMANVQK